MAAAHLLSEVAVGRYRFHDLMRLFAVERAAATRTRRRRRRPAARLVSGGRLGREPVLDPARDRVVATPRSRPRELPFGADADEALAFLDGERDNLVPVAAFALRHGHDRAVWQLSLSDQRLFESGATPTAGSRSNELGLAAAASGADPVVEGLMRSGLGVAYIAARRYADALGELRAACG